jgi:hypothetical protein
MRLASRIVQCTAAAVVLGVAALAAYSQEKKDEGGPADEQAAAMKRWMDTLKPGERHKALEPLVGTWDTVMRMWMGGPGAPPSEEKGTAVHKWVLGGRHVHMEASGSFAGMPFGSISVIGYDNFKKHYVSAQVDTISTTIYTSDGAADRSGKAFHLYGKIDEPMDGTVGKNVRVTWRIAGPDKLFLEIHDLDIGETDTKVIEVEYTRRK